MGSGGFKLNSLNEAKTGDAMSRHTSFDSHSGGCLSPKQNLTPCRREAQSAHVQKLQTHIQAHPKRGLKPSALFPTHPSLMHANECIQARIAFAWQIVFGEISVPAPHADRY